MRVLGIDPGTRKSGYALVENADDPPLRAGIAPTEQLLSVVRELVQRFPIGAIALGRGTHALAVAVELENLGVPVHPTDEYATTWRARALYFADHPRRGWRRLLPVGMQLPPRPIDDYAALLIARRFLTAPVR